jgi:hypothetical protein
MHPGAHGIALVSYCGRPSFHPAGQSHATFEMKLFRLFAGYAQTPGRRRPAAIAWAWTRQALPRPFCC